MAFTSVVNGQWKKGLAVLLLCLAPCAWAVKVSFFSDHLPPRSEWLVQTGTFKTLPNAQRMMYRLKGMGHDSAEVIYHQSFYNVVVKPAKGQAKRALAKLKLEYKDAYLRNDLSSRGGKVPLVGD